MKLNCLAETPLAGVPAFLSITSLISVTKRSSARYTALRQSLRYLGKRFRALWIALAALSGAFVLMLLAACVNQIA